MVKKPTLVKNEHADETPPAIEGHGGVIFDAHGGQQPSDGGKPIIDDEKTATVLNAMEIAAVVGTIQTKFRINPQVGIQIVHLAMQAAAQDAQTRAMIASLPEEPINDE